jgi:aminopeptidase N
MRWTLLTGLAGANAVTETEIDAEKARDHTATGRERAARALAAIPTPQLKEAAWRSAVAEDGMPNSVVDAVALGFGRAGAPEVLAPFVERYHAMLDHVEDKKSHAIIEAIVTGFYPRALASAALREAALVRLVAENRDGVARALAAQTRDARD